jgi:hypothetical protein
MSTFFYFSKNFNLFFKFSFVSTNFTKLEDPLQPAFESSGQFLLTNINFSKFFDCNWYFLTLVSILVKEKIISISIYDPTMPNIWQPRKLTIRNIDSCFYHHCKGQFISFTFICYFLIFLFFLVDQFFGQFICASNHLKDI